MAFSIQSTSQAITSQVRNTLIALRERRDLLASSIQSILQAIASQVGNPPQFVENQEQNGFRDFMHPVQSIMCVSVANVRVVSGKLQGLNLIHMDEI